VKNQETQHSTLVTDLAHASDLLQGVTDLQTLARNTIEATVTLTHCVLASFMIFNVLQQKLLLEQRHGLVPRQNQTPRIELTDEPGQVFGNGGEVLLWDTEEKHQFLILFDNDAEEKIQWELRTICPISEHVVGILSIGKKESGADYTKEELDVLRVFVNMLSMACHKLHDAFKPQSESFPNVTRKTLTSTVEPRIYFRQPQDKSEILGVSREIQHIRDVVQQIATEDVPVLIIGESGTGKELIARSIHYNSKRKDRPMVAMNCAALPDSLVESELFGYEKGAFTGASKTRKGKFEYADGSTLFLDEIGDMSPATQAKLLRVLQDGSFQRVGSNNTRYADVRIIAATNKNLVDAIRTQSFRQDLYYRLNVVQIQIPPLRERKEDIHFLAQYYFDYYNRFYKKNLRGIDDEAMDWLLNYQFPGNVRELMNIIERSVIMEKGEKISIHWMPALQDRISYSSYSYETPLTLEELEKRHIKFVMERVKNNKSAAARALGIARKTLREKLAKYRID